jgi:Spy/CpxP family protein refolding chaperone
MPARTRGVGFVFAALFIRSLSMRMPQKSLLSLVVAGLLVVPALAQKPIAGANPFAGGKLFILQSADVQKELQLTDTQVDKVKEIAEKQRNAFKNLPKDKEEFAKKIQEMQKEIEEREKQLADLLKPNQVKRLDQILLQQQGASALLSPKIVEDLKITEEQKTKITESMKESAKERLDLFPKGGKIDPDEIAKKLQEHQAKSLENAVKVLTPEQQKQWKAKVGETFKGKLFSFPFPGGFPRPNIIK